VRPLISTGAVTRNPDYTDHRRIPGHIPPLGLEASLYSTWDESVVDDLRHLPFVTAHADKRIGATLSTDHPDFDRFALDCRMARGLGADLVVLHLWELPDGDQYLDRNLAHLPTLLDIADNHGVALTVETIPCTAGSPIDNVRRACERDARCRATLDTEFLAAHDQLNRADELRDVVAHVHVKDFHPAVWNTKPRRYLLPGEGVLDLEGFLDRLDWSGTVTLEMSAVRDDGSIDDDRLETAVAWLRRLSA
jgi:sugar phosphate isomerase/epimerase